MVDSFVARNAGVNQVQVSALHESSTRSNLINNAANLSFEPTLDVKESLEWLLGAEEESILPTDERLIRRERRFDLMVWLLNLEPRLGPYGGAGEA